ncbi:Acetylglutamate kinase [Anaerohalosphaera lusitana]|uniref:Acetylglutamate kinase n=1 Tax=Anaerohalosphaera lusitana TaxID=1936003 RepID=A0A1U9NR60_9BACT|nr:acetylglutamate kinase [Anaerohalosphaera lusitana]AQT70208.1 Acetylglutamate kinase [Anaerohalosphaera lusitana]
MKEAIKKAKALIEAMEYIQEFRGKIVVIKLGGSILDDLELQKKLLKDVVFMATVGMHPVLVHGGGKAITRAMQEAGLAPTWVHGRRYTDERTLAIAEHTLVHKVNAGIAQTLREIGADAMGLHSLSSCVLFAKPLKLTGDNGRKLDVGMVGTIEDVNADLLKTLCESGTIPVIAPVAMNRMGTKLNVNADSAAGEVAAALKAEKLVVLSDTHGIFKDIDDPSSQISSATEQEVEAMVEDGIISAGMLPKVESCFTALKGGAGKAHIIDGRIEHSLLLEIYTEKGIGTQITR